MKPGAIMEKLYWYDSQAHPDDSTLASTHPHHKHIPPDIKHHRVPAPGLSFMAPNLLQMIREVETLIEHVCIVLSNMIGPAQLPIPCAWQESICYVFDRSCLLTIIPCT